MISWIQHHLIRHGRWIFLTLLAVIIVAFVFTIGNTPGCTTDRSGYEENLFYGIDLNAPRERDVIVQKVSISAFLNNQQFRSDQQFQTALTNRIALLHLADQTDIPGPSQQALADYIQTKPAFQGPEGNFSRDEFTRFVDNFESNPRAPQGLVMQVLAEDYRIDQAEAAISGPGYSLPSEALAQTRRGKTELELATAKLSFSEFNPELNPTEENLRDYYETNKQDYEIPERIVASYVFFPVSDHTGQLPPADDAQLREHFAQNREELVAAYRASQEDSEPAPEIEPEKTEEEEKEEAPVTFDQARPFVAQSYAEQQAMRAANEAAQAFAFQLYRDEISRDSAAFNQLLNESNLSLNKIEPYTRAGAKRRALSPELLESAFTLGGNRYFSDAYPIDGGFAVLIYESRIAPIIPPFESVADEVREAYSRAEERRLFEEKGETVQAELDAALAGEQTFTEAAEALGLSVETFERFAVRDAPRSLNRSILNQAQTMEPGELSSMLSMGSDGTFVYVQSKDVPEIDSENEDFTQAQAMLKNWSTYATRSGLLNELVARGLPEQQEVPTQ
jgi:peptidyl-prolyl cis-trans isomerase D